MIHDYYFKPDCLIYYRKMNNNFKESCLKTTLYSNVLIEEKLKLDSNSEYIEQFKSNQFFIYCHGLRVLGLNYIIYILTLICIYLYYFLNGDDALIYGIFQSLAIAIIALVAIWGKFLFSSFSNSKCWTYSNNLRLYAQIFWNVSSLFNSIFTYIRNINKMEIIFLYIYINLWYFIKNEQYH
jgi:hypothetical protein